MLMTPSNPRPSRKGADAAPPPTLSDVIRRIDPRHADGHLADAKPRDWRERHADMIIGRRER